MQPAQGLDRERCDEISGVKNMAHVLLVEELDRCFDHGDMIVRVSHDSDTHRGQAPFSGVASASRLSGSLGAMWMTGIPLAFSRSELPLAAYPVISRHRPTTRKVNDAGCR